MLTENQLQFIRENRVFQLGAYLQSAMIDYGECCRDLKAGKSPKKRVLSAMHMNMLIWHQAMDLYYIYPMPTSRVGEVLNTEQTAWQLLSPVISRFLEKFGEFIETRDIEDCDSKIMQDLTNLLREFYDLLQKWNQIPDSFKSKEQRLLDRIAVGEAALEELIEKLRAAATCVLK